VNVLPDTCAVLALARGDLPARAAKALALREDLAILSSDQTLPRYPGIRTLW
jgi:hypothetical protein